MRLGNLMVSILVEIKNLRSRVKILEKGWKESRAMLEKEFEPLQEYLSEKKKSEGRG